MISNSLLYSYSKHFQIWCNKNCYPIMNGAEGPNLFHVAGEPTTKWNLLKCPKVVDKLVKSVEKLVWRPAKIHMTAAVAAFYGILPNFKKEEDLPSLCTMMSLFKRNGNIDKQSKNVQRYVFAQHLLYFLWCIALFIRWCSKVAECKPELLIHKS